MSDHDAQVPPDQDVDEAPDESEEQLELRAKTLISLFPVTPTSRTSNCAFCARLNPDAEGMILRNQMIRVPVEGKRVKFMKGEVKLKMKTFTKCGPDVNPDCPASQLRLVVGINVEVKAAQYLKAQQEHNYLLVAEIARDVSLLDEALQARFSAACKAGEQNAATSE